MKLILVFAIIACFIFGCSSSKKLKQSRVYLKQYAYCRCAKFASADSAFFSNDISTGIYADIARYSRSALNKIDDLARRYASAIKPSAIADHQNQKAILLNCFTFYESRQLDSLVKTLDKEFMYTKGW